jgi:adenylate kinase
MTGGSVLQFNAEEHKAIYEHLQELPKQREFLSRFRIFYSQADEKQMDCHIKRELQQCMKLRECEVELAYMCFRDLIEDWWQNSNFFLKEPNCNENDLLRTTSEKVRTTLVTKILDQRKCELDNLRVKFKESAITDTKQLIEPHKAVLIYAKGESTTVTAAKIHQTLRGTKHIMLKLQQLLLYKSEVILAWKNLFNILVVEGDSSTESFQDIFSKLTKNLSECVVEKKFIFITSSTGNVQQISALRSTFRTKLTEEYDDWKFNDIVAESQTPFLEKKVYFQGAEIKLGDIVKKNDIGVLNALDPESISLLLDNEKPSIGVPIEDTVQYYIDRTLQLQANMLYKEENLEREATEVWKPSTLLDGADRVILVIDAAGMGKSALLTHLAKQTQESHLQTWVVRVNLNNYTRILYEIQTNGSDEDVATKLLKKAALVKETDGLSLEKRLFNHAYNLTGNMSVLIDGVDEVTPHYTEEVKQVVKILSETEIEKIWVTSRNSMKGVLERELLCRSYALLPFNEADQESFLVKFWSGKYSKVPRNCLGNLAKRVVGLSMKHLNVGDRRFMGSPLQSMVLAEMFGKNLEHYSTSESVELPEYINLVVIHDLLVSWKWEIYVSEKKRSDRTNVNVLSDDKKLREHFIHNHTAAAFLAILSTHHVQKIAGETIAKKGEEFLQEIDKGTEKTGVITSVIDGRPVFQHRTLADYFFATWLCDHVSASQTFMRDHIFDSGFSVVRSMVDRILADRCPLHEAVLNLNLCRVENLLQEKESICKKDRGGRTPLHIAVSCKNTEIIRLLLEHGADAISVDTFLGLSPVDYASRMDDWEILSLIMEKRPDIREHVLNRANFDCTETTASALHAAAKYGHNDLLKYLKRKVKYVNKALPSDNRILLHEAPRSLQIETLKVLVQLGGSTDSKDGSGKHHSMCRLKAETSKY